MQYKTCGKGVSPPFSEESAILSESRHSGSLQGILLDIASYYLAKLLHRSPPSLCGSLPKFTCKIQKHAQYGRTILFLANCVSYCFLLGKLLHSDNLLK